MKIFSCPVLKYKECVFLLIMVLLTTGCADRMKSDNGSNISIIESTETPGETQTSDRATTIRLSPTHSLVESENSTTAVVDSIPSVQVTPAISTTIVTSTTSIITGTGIFTDVAVPRGGIIQQATWGGDGDSFAVGTSIGLFLYDTVSLHLINTIDVGNYHQSILINPLNDSIAAGSLNGDILWFSLNDGRYLTSFEGHSMGVTSLVYPGQGFPLISGSDDGSVRTWSPAVMNDLKRSGSPSSNILKSANRVTSMDIDTAGNLLAVGSYRSWYVWDFSIGKAAVEMEDLNGWINDIAFSQGGEYLAVADSSNVVRIWKTNDWTLSFEVGFRQVDLITTIDFEPDRLILIIGAENGTVVAWNLSTNESFTWNDLNPYGVSDILFNPAGTMILIASDKGFVRLLTAP